MLKRRSKNNTGLWKLIRIRAKNFWLFEDVDVSFDRLPLNAIIFVQGINHDSLDAKSNYSGKTTLMYDLFEWILLGNYKRLKRVSDVIGKFDKFTMGSLTYRFNNNDLVITRYRNDPKFKNHLTVQWCNDNVTGERIVESQEMFTKIVGMSPQRFVHGVLFSSNSERDLFQMSPAIRNKFLSDLWNLNEFDEAAKLCGKVCSDLDKRILAIKQRHEILLEARKHIDEFIKEYLEANENFINDVEARKRKIKKHLVELDTAKDYVKEVEEQLIVLKEKRQKYNDSIIELKRRILQSNVVTDEISTLKAKINSFKEKLNECNDEQEILKKEISDIIAGLKVKSFCEFCGNKVTNASKAVLVEMRQSKIRGLRKKKVDIKLKIKTNRLKLKEKIDELSRYNIEITVQRLGGIANKLTNLNEKIAEAQMLLDNSVDIGKQIVIWKKKLSSIKLTQNTYSDKLIKKELERKKNINICKKLNKTLGKLIRKYNIYRLWGSNDGFKKLRNLMLTDHVSALSSVFVSFLDAFTEGSISGRWSVDQEAGNIECILYDTLESINKHYEGFSSGQHAKLNCANDIATAMLCAPHIGHMNIDEKFDKGIDFVGFQKILNVLKNRKDISKCIFLTSHRSGIERICDAVLRIERREGRATVMLEYQ